IDYPPDPSASQGLLGRGVTASSGFALPAQGERQSPTRSTCSCPRSGKTPDEKRRLVAGQPGSAKPNRATDPPSQRDQRDKNTASRPRTNSTERTTRHEQRQIRPRSPYHAVPSHS